MLTPEEIAETIVGNFCMPPSDREGFIMEIAYALKEKKDAEIDRLRAYKMPSSFANVMLSMKLPDGAFEIDELLAEIDRLRAADEYMASEYTMLESECYSLRKKLDLAIDGLSRSCSCDTWPYPELGKCIACEKLEKIRGENAHT